MEMRLLKLFIIEKKYDVPKKKIVEFINNRRKNFDKINPYPRIDLIRLNYNYYTNIKKILKEKVKDIDVENPIDVGAHKKNSNA